MPRTSQALPSAGSTTTLDIPFTIKDKKKLPKGLEASVRWDPIDVALAPVAPADEVATPAPAEAAPTDAAPATAAPAEATPAQAPTQTGAPAKSDAEGDLGTAKAPINVGTPSGLLIPQVAPVGDATERVEAPADMVDLVVPERVGDVVSPANVKTTKKALRVPVTLPTTAGKYRLTVSLHDADGVEYDALTQALIPSLIVRVTGAFDGDIQAAASADLTAGADVALGVRVRNLGIAAWGKEAIKPTSNLSGWTAAAIAKLTGRWIPLADGAALPAAPEEREVSEDLPIGLAPGKSFDASLALKAPKAPGTYLLLLDVVTPDLGSLVASGANPTLVRVTVVAAAAR